MSDEVMVALITAWSTVIVAIVGAGGVILSERRRSKRRDEMLEGRLDEIAGDARGTREQVQNTHTTNLRDDIDRLSHTVEENHREVTRRLDRLDERVSSESFDADEEHNKLRHLINQVASTLIPSKGS